ncbi:MAG: phosphatidate cytidylyltransferase, partial [Clostridia bacterium]|nr:phosphatidate cytidylyltransferase [Clostridia bacterium]
LKRRLKSALPLVLFLGIVLALGGWVLGITVMGAICIALHEEFHALSVSGHRPVQWPTWLGMVASIPLVLIHSSKAIVPLLMLQCLIITMCVIFREKPSLEDALLSIMPLLTVLLPGMCVLGMVMIDNRALQLSMLCLVFVISVLGDTAAYFVGSRVGGPKLCPQVSPNKTISGAIGGLVGSMLGSLLVASVVYLCAPGSRVILPKLWEYLLIGLMGGVAGQVGDLFCSMIKRHCGIKDFSGLFPGHGGMLDRLDSILFTALVVFSYLILKG